MSQSNQPTFFRNALTVAWALFTLILVFIVVLLANELMKSGKNPLDLAKSNEGNVPSAAAQSAPLAGGEMRTVKIFAASADGRMLVEETRSIPLGDYTVENCKTALLELKKQGAGGNTFPVLPQGADFNALYLVDGQLIIDFTARLPAEAAKSASAEALLIYGIVNTVTQKDLQGTLDGAVKSVRFLIDGAPPGDNFPAHLDLSQPITRNEEWILKTEAPQPANG